MAETIRSLSASYRDLQRLHNRLVADFEALVLLLIEKKLVGAAELQHRFSTQQAHLDQVLAMRRSDKKKGTASSRQTGKKRSG